MPGGGFPRGGSPTTWLIFIFQPMACVTCRWPRNVRRDGWSASDSEPVSDGKSGLNLSHNSPSAIQTTVAIINRRTFNSFNEDPKALHIGQTLNISGQVHWRQQLNLIDVEEAKRLCASYRRLCESLKWSRVQERR